MRWIHADRAALIAVDDRLDNDHQQWIGFPARDRCAGAELAFDL
jgi:hypothetical protein